VQKYQIPLIICTSKTRAQTEIYRSRLNLNYPLIVENGGAIYFPPGSFPLGRLPSGSLYKDGEYFIEMTDNVEKLLPELQLAAHSSKAHIEIVFDMSLQKIRQITGVSLEEAKFMKRRDYTVYFLCHSRKDELFAELRNRGLKPTWGSYFCHLGTSNSKGLAAQHLMGLYRNLGFYKLITAGFGDNMNDLSLLQVVNLPYLVEQPGGGYAPEVEVEGLVKLAGIGPIGWNKGVKELISSIDWKN
jgi:mannosyl-3-phosphoglycerate phosphatase